VLWINGTHAVLTKLNNGDVSRFGGIRKNAENEKRARSMLEQSWEVTDKQQLLSVISDLSEGLHNKQLLKEADNAGLLEIEREAFEQALSELSEQASIVSYQNMYSAYEQFGESAILGWDLSRATSLCAYGYVAGYLTYEEAVSRALEIALRIQQVFDSWDSFYDSYLYGYQYWREDDPSDTSSGYINRIQVIEELNNDDNSPFKLSWDLQLT